MSNDEVLAWLLESITDQELAVYIDTVGNNWLVEANLLIIQE